MPSHGIRFIRALCALAHLRRPVTLSEARRYARISNVHRWYRGVDGMVLKPGVCNEAKSLLAPKRGGSRHQSSLLLYSRLAQWVMKINSIRIAFRKTITSKSDRLSVD